jgi:hypothetical protein
MSDKQSIERFNRTVAMDGNNRYIPTKMNIGKSDEETKHVISNTFGQFLKNNLEAFWSETCLGFDPNVTMAYQEIMTNPNNAINIDGKTYYPHSGVGNLQAYNESGNPSGGCFTMYTMA